MTIRLHRGKLSAAAAVLLLSTASGVHADVVSKRGTTSVQQESIEHVDGVVLPQAMPEEAYGMEGSCTDCQDACYTDDCGRGFYGGVEYLHIRASFSEAVAFARVSQSIVGGVVNASVTAEELDFDYEPSFRTYIGYDLNGTTDVRFTYWFYDGDVAVDGVEDGGPGQFIVDPFGNIGTEFNTTASVQMNVFDIDLGKTFESESKRLSLRAAAGVRGADIDQFYDSFAFDAAGNLAGSGDFFASFTGVGPRLDLQANAVFGRRHQFALTSKGVAAVLIGDYDVSNSVDYIALVGGQSASRTRAVPVLEGELGGTWKPSESITISAGWLFQAWFNVGVSGGHFNNPFDNPDGGSYFGGADDGDIMSFDGLFVRTEIDF